MPSFKMILGKVHADGCRSVLIRLTHNRKNTSIQTPFVLEAKEVSQSGKIKNQRIVDAVEDIMRKYRSITEVVDCSMLDLADVRKMITEHKEDDGVFHYDFLKYCKDEIDELRENGHGGNADVHSIAVNSFKNFLMRDELDVTELTAELLKGWLKWMNGKKRAVSLYPAIIQSIYRKMQREFNDEDAGVIRLPRNPFGSLAIPKFVPSRKRALSVEELRRIITAEKHHTEFKGKNYNDRENLARDLFTLSFLLIGINEVDLYEATRYEDGRLIYERKKTRNRRADRAEMSVKVEPEAMAYLNKYRDETGQRVFKFYKMYSSQRAFNMTVSYGMRALGKRLGIDRLTYYAARHTWATIAFNDCHIDKYTVHLALNHVDPGTAITDVYIKKDWRIIDEANRKVIDYISKVD